MATMLRNFRKVQSFGLNVLRNNVTRPSTCITRTLTGHIYPSQVSKVNGTCFLKCKSFPSVSLRSYSHAPLSISTIQERILLVLRLFDKIDPEKVTLESHFLNDLGLDSLDHVEVIMAVEDEFGFEIPDIDAEKLLKPQDIVQYICDKEDVFE